MLFGFPVHAGIDPLQLPTRSCSQRFPRTRGDRPVIISDWLVSFTVSPYTRG